MKKNHNQKGQAAMDLLLTYGWVLLIIIGIISVLTFSGIFDIGFLNNNKCTSNHPTHCSSFQATLDNENIILDIILQNIGAQTINITSISFSDENTNTCTNNQLNNIVEPGEKTQIITNCQNLNLIESKKGNIKAEYILFPSEFGIQQNFKGNYQINQLETTKESQDNKKKTIPITSKEGETINLKINDNTKPISQTNPILITTPTDLNNLRHTLNNKTITHFQLQQNINLNNQDTDDNPSNGNWQPIGNLSNKFNSNFNGNGHTIQGLNINHTSETYTGTNNYQGLFGYVENATISNIHITGNVTGHSIIGGLIGQGYNITVTNSSFSGNIKGKLNTGGLIGQTSESTFNKTHFKGTINAGTGNAGGLIGNNYQSNITSSYATGKINQGSNSKGGLIGLSQGNSQITSSYATIKITNSGGSGLIGSISITTGTTTCTNSYWDTQTSGRTSSPCGTGKTTTELQTPTSNTGIYSNWNTNIWNFGTTTQYPTLK